MVSASPVLSVFLENIVTIYLSRLQTEPCWEHFCPALLKFCALKIKYWRKKKEGAHLLFCTSNVSLFCNSVAELNKFNQFYFLQKHRALLSFAFLKTFELNMINIDMVYIFPTSLHQAMFKKINITNLDFGIKKSPTWV